MKKIIRKINHIESFIKSHSENDTARQLLSYVGELEKDFYRKKFGLVFEKHKENIDEILEKNTSVLCEEKDLLIQNDGNMNFYLKEIILQHWSC